MKTKFLSKIGTMFFNHLGLSLILLAVVFFMLLIPQTWINLWETKRLMLIYAVVIAAFIQIFIQKDKLVFNKIDVLFLGFIIWNFISYFWATNPSLIWGKSFVWLFLYCLYKIVSSIDFSKLNLKIGLDILLLGLIFNNLMLAWFYITISTEGETFGFSYVDIAKTRTYLSYTSNEIGSLLAITFPLYVLLWHYRRKWNFLTLTLALFHVLFLFGLNCRGAFLAVILQLMLLGVLNIKNIRKFIWIFPIGLILFISTNFLIQDKQNFYQIYNPLKGILNEHDERLIMWDNSIKVWQENILVGKGAGNWMIEYTEYAQDLMFGYDGYTYYQHPHNIYFHLLSELGLIGLLCYLLFIVYFLFLYLKKIKASENQPIYQTLLFILVAYLVTSSFFGIVYSERFHPVFYQVFLFFSFGIGVAVHHKKVEQKQFYLPFKISIFLLSVLYLCYFYFCMNHQRLQNQFIRLKNKGQYEAALNIFDDLYHPVYSTMMKRANGEIALKTQKALILWEQNDHKAAIDVMFEAMKDQPFYHMNWFHMGNMYNGIQDDENAKICYENVYSLRSNFMKAKIKLVQINLAQNNKEEAEKWFHLANSQVSNFIKRSHDTEDKSKRVEKLPIYKTFKEYEQQLIKLKQQLELK